MQMKYLKPMKLYQQLLRSDKVTRGRLLGLDVGDKYVGLSISDADNKVASPVRLTLILLPIPFCFCKKKCIFLLDDWECVNDEFYDIICFFICSVLVRTKTNIDLVASDVKNLVSFLRWDLLF